MLDQKTLIQGVLMGDEKACIVILDAVDMKAFSKIFYKLFDRETFEVKYAWSGVVSTPQWLLKTFKDFPKLHDAVFISANPFAEKYARYLQRKFKHVVLLSAKYWSESDTVHPARVTMALRLATLKYRKVVAHYMQPHPPFIVGEQVFRELNRKLSLDLRGSRIEYILARKSPAWRKVFKLLYEANIYYILYHLKKYVIPWLRRRKFKVYLTADHGELLGVYKPYILGKPVNVVAYALGIYRWIGHNVRHKDLYVVPWVKL